MINFFKGGILDAIPELVIDFGYLEFLIRNNPRKDEIEALRSLEYKCDAYEKVKVKLPYITPHGTFYKNREAANIKEVSGYLYFDVDQKDINCDVEEYKSFILDKHSDKICMLGKSIGGQGLFFYVKVKYGLGADNFEAVLKYFREEVFADLSLDPSIKDISRAQFLTYDTDLYTNHSVVADIPVYFFSNSSVTVVRSEYKSSSNKQTKGAVRCIKERKDMYTSKCTLIKYEDVCANLLLETKIEFPNDEDVIVKEIDFVRVPILPSIKTGSRHRMFKIMVNTLLHLNPQTTFLQVHSYINFWNQHMTADSLDRKDFMNTIEREFNRLKDGGKNISRIKKKYVHTNPKYSRQKIRREIANREVGKLKVSRSIDIIKTAIEKIKAEGKPVTQKNVLAYKEGKISIRTIKKHWCSVVTKEERIMPSPIHELEPKLEPGTEQEINSDNINFMNIKEAIEKIKDVSPTISKERILDRLFRDYQDEYYKENWYGKISKTDLYLQFLEQYEKEEQNLVTV